MTVGQHMGVSEVTNEGAHALFKSRWSPMPTSWVRSGEATCLLGPVWGLDLWCYKRLF
jgi:hypothetical protein